MIERGILSLGVKEALVFFFCFVFKAKHHPLTILNSLCNMYKIFGSNLLKITLFDFLTTHPHHAWHMT